MVGWIFCSIVSMAMVLWQMRVISRAIKNTEASIETAVYWRGKAETATTVETDLVAVAAKALVALRTTATHLETANRILLEEGVTEPQEDFNDEQDQIAEARGVADSLAAVLTKLSVNTDEPLCTTCDGHGFYMVNAHGPQEMDCHTCNGSGVLKTTKKKGSDGHAT